MNGLPVVGDMKAVENVAIIGAGNMAEAMAGALISSGNVQSRQLTLCDLRQDRLTYL
ncbi:MAG: NAD(P)-binding domain-containing protein, partial [Candidatus Poseidoniaceae archaeon]